MDIQWYPGHMAKTKRVLKESLALVDVVVELLDARIPWSSKNPDLEKLAAGKRWIVVLNKSDLADETYNRKWGAFYEAQGKAVVMVNSLKGKGIKEITETARELMKEKIERQKQRGRIFVPIRAVIVGIPNVGKSTLINQYVGKAITKTGDKPGVTKSKQWVKIKKDFELLDTPGILWPKFEDRKIGIHLALTGAINDTILDQYTLSLELAAIMMRNHRQALWERYKVELDGMETPETVVYKIGESRKFLKKGGGVDLERTAIVFLDEFRGGKLGKITLESPEDFSEIKE